MCQLFLNAQDLEDISVNVLDSLVSVNVNEIVIGIRLKVVNRLHDVSLEPAKSLRDLLFLVVAPTPLEKSLGNLGNRHVKEEDGRLFPGIELKGGIEDRCLVRTS